MLIVGIIVIIVTLHLARKFVPLMQTTWVSAGDVVEDTFRTDGPHGVVWMWGENVSPSGAINAMSQARLAVNAPASP
jgi:hypothetical protein